MKAYPVNGDCYHFNGFIGYGVNPSSCIEIQSVENLVITSYQSPCLQNIIVTYNYDQSTNGVSINTTYAMSFIIRHGSPPLNYKDTGHLCVDGGQFLSA